MWIIVVATLLVSVAAGCWSLNVRAEVSLVPLTQATAGIYRLVVERYCRTSFSSVVSDSAPRSLRTEGLMWRPGVSPTHRARLYTSAAILVCPQVCQARVRNEALAMAVGRQALDGPNAPGSVTVSCRRLPRLGSGVLSHEEKCLRLRRRSAPSRS